MFPVIVFGLSAAGTLPQRSLGLENKDEKTQQQHKEQTAKRIVANSVCEE